jgi:hypothetical protein
LRRAKNENVGRTKRHKNETALGFGCGFSFVLFAAKEFRPQKGAEVAEGLRAGSERVIFFASFGAGGVKKNRRGGNPRRGGRETDLVGWDQNSPTGLPSAM